MAKNQRSDAERRLRQCERLSRLLRTLHLIMGKGRWDADGLAEELECSRRTVYRILQTLSMAGVPWYFDEAIRAYRVRPGFKFPMVDQPQKGNCSNRARVSDLKPQIEKFIADGQLLIQRLSDLSNDL